MEKGFGYLVTIIGWHSRKILYVFPQIMNTDQDVQFISEVFTSVLKNHPIQISMDGKVVTMIIFLLSDYGEQLSTSFYILENLIT
ncbi:hypothetical protein SAMN05421863_101142 [Nitrosomonas communis]|uniref:Uncharacterized protein n=1 Tax=Nitrosomonas communis TaxID=44574 RepID=A0A1I4MR98_9PROT|nr:hypothetical protein SAMN05421863_101142 [Nitrosomonas communis]